MHRSNQEPLTAPRRPAGDMRQSRQSWDAAAFDAAEYFSICELRVPSAAHGRWDRRTTLFRDFPPALQYAREHVETGACLYAVTKSGSTAPLDPDKWDEWFARWERNQ